MMCAEEEIRSRETSTPRALSPSSSVNSTSGSTTTPLPITGVHPGERMPEGSRCRAYFSSPTTTVWPALFPPLNFTTKSTCELSWSVRSEEHTSELQSRGQLVCRLLLDKKKNATQAG